MRHLSEQNSNLGDARRITKENALTDLYIYLFGTKIVETIDETAARQTAVTLCRAVLFKAIKQPTKYRQNTFRKTAEAATRRVQTKPNKKKYPTILLHQHKPVL